MAGIYVPTDEESGVAGNEARSRIERPLDSSSPTKGMMILLRTGQEEDGVRFVPILSLYVVFSYLSGPCVHQFARSTAITFLYCPMILSMRGLTHHSRT